jgi:hypothetical protein
VENHDFIFAKVDHPLLKITKVGENVQLPLKERPMKEAKRATSSTNRSIVIKAWYRMQSSPT